MSSPQDAQQLLEAFERLTGILTAQRNNSASSINVNAGGAATWLTAWVSTCACCMMLGMAVVGAFWISSAFQQSAQERAALKETAETQQAYLNVLMQNAKKESK